VNIVKKLNNYIVKYYLLLLVKMINFLAYMNKCFTTKNESEKLKALLTAIIMSSFPLVSDLEIPLEIRQRIKS
jgi:hypothetical protein